MTAVARRVEWHKLKDLLWWGDRPVVQAGLPLSQLSGIWQMFLLGNGSPTRLLQLVSHSPVGVELIATDVIGDRTDSAPAEIKLIAVPRVRRQIWLKSERSGEIFAYAVSWWHKADLEQFVPNPHLPIGTNLQLQNLEVYRDLRAVYQGRCPALAAVFGTEGPCWGRHYLIWHGGRPITLIYEIFNPALGQYLGQEVPPPPPDCGLVF
ncbi:MAG: chorismate lyase [Pseudanabaenaceae cyanobacterium]